MAASRNVWIEGPAGRLEAALRAAGAPRAAALLAHPHPSHGGTLHNPVVFHADRELHRAGLTTLRFNFRGVGRSQGAYDEGRGELADVAAAARWLHTSVPGVPLILVGYSFGALCVLRHGAASADDAGIVAIGLPVKLYAIPEIGTLERPVGVVQASDDELGRPEEVRLLFRDAAGPRRLYEVEGTGHLFPGRAPDAARRVVAAADWVLSRSAAARAGSAPPLPPGPPE